LRFKNQQLLVHPMKKIILFLALTLTTTTATFAQFKKAEQKETTKFTEIGKIQPLGQPVQMECKKTENDIYAFTYRDAAYKTLDQYEHFLIKDVDNAFDSLFNAIVEGFETKPKEPIVLETDNQYIYIQFVQNFGTLVSLGSSDKADGARKSYSATFTKKQIEKLFGKKK